MKRARAFFYVSLGILALALAFHLGASTARSQAASSIVVGGADETNYVNTTVAIDQSGQLWMNSNNGLVGPYQLPKPGQVAAASGWGPYYALVLYTDGDDWEGDASGGGPMRWHLRANLLSNGPVQTQRETWGRVKADRR
jgi:hypothetical protein